MGRWCELLADPETLTLPPPEVTSRDGATGPVPKTAQALADLAAANGWAVQVTYARGPRMHSAHGKFLRMVDSIAVRMRRGDQLAFGFWTAGKFDNATGWTFGKMPEHFGAEEIKDYVRRTQ